MGWKVVDPTSGELRDQRPDEADASELHRVGTRISGHTLAAIDASRGGMSRMRYMRLMLERSAEVQSLGEVMKEHADELVELRNTVAQSAVLNNLCLQVIAGDMAAAEGVVLNTDALRREYLGRAAARIHQHQHKLLGGSGVAH